jgi:hypothetical protein
MTWNCCGSRVETLSKSFRVRLEPYSSEEYRLFPRAIELCSALIRSRDKLSAPIGRGGYSTYRITELYVWLRNRLTRLRTGNDGVLYPKSY